MKPFHFSLAALLVVRRRAEDLAGQNYARALQASRAAQERLAFAHAQIETACATHRRLILENAPAPLWAQAESFRRQLSQQRRFHQKQLAEAATALDDALAALISARRSRQAVENLRERQQACHRCAAEKEEQKVLDELVVLRQPRPAASLREPL